MTSLSGYGFFVASGLFLYSVVAPASAEQMPSPVPVDIRPSVVAAPITAPSPVIDGLLDDAAWADAAVTEDFRQVLPVESADPSERTEIRIVYDADRLYVAIRAYDDDPAAIIAREYERDGRLGNDDNVAIILDTYNSGRDAYYFQVNPRGARRDALIENNTRVNIQWDAIWRAAARIDDVGWTAEMEIPFRSLAYETGPEGWGMQIVRVVRRKTETIRWAAPSRSLSDTDVSRAGRLLGIDGVDGGVGLEATGYLAVRWNYDALAAQDPHAIDIRPSIDINYRVASSMTASLTAYPDFSDAPLDERQVNTSRFSLFFPETRNFFLQDASLFSFGGRSYDILGSNATPFFSRRIGRVNGEPVDIRVGGKVSGSHGRLNLGALAAQTGRTDFQDVQTLTVLRPSLDFGEGARAGLILTHGDPTGATTNTVAGADFEWRDSRLFDGDIVQTGAYYMRSLSDLGADRGEAWGLGFSFPNDKWYGEAHFQHVSDGFDPKLGFANRTGVSRFYGDWQRRFRPSGGPIRHISFGNWNDFVFHQSGGLESRTIGFYGCLQTNADDSGCIAVREQFDEALVPFSLPGGLTVPAGEYTFRQGRLYLTTSGRRPVSGSAELWAGGFYGGERQTLTLNLKTRLTPRFSTDWRHVIDRIALPSGDVTIHISSLSAKVNFTPNMQFANEIQYDNITENLTYLGRFRWEIRPATELLIALSYAAESDFRDLSTLESGAAIRIGNTFRF